jgi:manganese efflux pump family protein
MFARWFPVYQNRAAATDPAPVVPAERHFPIAVVLGHGALAAITLLLVRIAAIQKS